MKLELQHVTKVIRRITVLNDVNLTLESGTIYGLRGINGSGKTMLMRLMAGLIRPTKGKVLLDGRRLGKELSFPSDMGMLIENPAFLDGYTAAQNLRLLAGIRKKVGEERIREILEQVGLGWEDKRKYRQFSLGMKQRLGIAGAVLEHPQLLLIDEPTNALDTDGVEMVQELLLEEKKRGALIVLACHDFSILQGLSDVLYSVKEGRVSPL
ncbi:ATP-binding cassette domain-containing protein [Acutalibacter sp. LFL-21]|uniref:ATP-binding cassette domain-containing protein n=1 Tax=Acutalibacter sp. LFL-21 TaxID=2983399 RepID=UPI0021D693CA|nr:ATP-binding cassette domain-containing protein [Acutalibacter sp. LFL-21]MCU7653432.1 ATP-binding cassette domain-containing protein [Acutalibacter sp. LFL-21]